VPQKFPRPDRQQQRMVARVAVVFLGFLAYRLIGDDRLVAGLMVWGGTVLAGLPLVDRATVGAERAGEMLQVGTMLLGLGLTAAGMFLALR
jgi:hypothetical protein